MSAPGLSLCLCLFGLALLHMLGLVEFTGEDDLLFRAENRHDGKCFEVRIEWRRRQWRKQRIETITGPVYWYYCGPLVIRREL